MKAISTYEQGVLVLLKIVHRKEARLLAALAAGGSCCLRRSQRPAAKKRPARYSFSFNPVSSFTPANADPKLAAALDDKGLALTDFKFTPAPAKGRPSQVRVAIRARAAAPTRPVLPMPPKQRRSTALKPTGYNLGVAVGWKRFAVSGDVAKIESANQRAGRPGKRRGGCQLFAQASV